MGITQQWHRRMLKLRRAVCDKVLCNPAAFPDDMARLAEVQLGLHTGIYSGMSA